MASLCGDFCLSTCTVSDPSWSATFSVFLEITWWTFQTWKWWENCNSFILALPQTSELPCYSQKELMCMQVVCTYYQFIFVFWQHLKMIHDTQKCVCVFHISYKMAATGIDHIWAQMLQHPSILQCYNLMWSWCNILVFPAAEVLSLICRDNNPLYESLPSSCPVAVENICYSRLTVSHLPLQRKTHSGRFSLLFLCTAAPVVF